MKTHPNILKSLSLAAIATLSQSLCADIAILQNWTLVEDPAHPGLTATSPTSTTSLLQAGNQAIPTATDIGYQSVNGANVAGSTTGFAFSPLSDFAVAIDYDLVFSNSPTGGLGLGFGIGETSDGANSAGGALFTSNGSPFSIGTFARVNDVNQTGSVSAPIVGLTGSINVAYTASSGDITINFANAGSEVSVFSGTFSGIQNSWAGDSLLVSFFLRSDGSLGQAWSGGNADATFSNLRVLSGSPVAVPEPSAFTLVLLVASATFVLQRRRN